MYNKKNYNNLFESICCVLLLIFSILFYSLMLYFAVINPNEGTNPIAALIISTVIFGLMIITLIILIIKQCYGYWYIYENEIISKKLFSKRIIIEINSIKNIEKKVVPFLIFGVYRSEAYIISDEYSEIVVLTKNKKNDILERLLNKNSEKL